VTIELLRSQKALADRAMAQVGEADLHRSLGSEGNSIAVLVQHLSGNQRSRWTDFLTTDGEKPDRQRDREFEDEGLTREELTARWESGWATLFSALAPLNEEDLTRTVTIRGEPHTVLQAIQRQLSHYAYHIGQIVQLARYHVEDRWESLSIPRGGSARFNREKMG